MELKHLLQLVSELPKNSKLNYVRGTDECKFIDVDIKGERINSETPTGEPKSWAPTYLAELAPKIFENEPFNLSGLLNNKGSFRPVLETIIAHTREFYTVRKGTATALVWIPSKPKDSLELAEIDSSDIPAAKPHSNENSLLPREELIAKVRESFLKYWNIIDQHGAQFKLYLNRFESTLNPLLEKLELGVSEIFEIVNFEQYKAVIDSVIKIDNSLSYLNDEKGPDGNRYYIWSTNRHFRNYLEILSYSDFFSNFKEQKKHTLAVISKTTASDQTQYLRAMRTKPFLLLAGISGTGKSRIVKQMAFDSCPDIAQLRADATSPGNYCLVEVKPNWHDSSELLGYESKINGDHYIVTPFINFLIKAKHYPDVPFFLCLDEMNLAPVEQYFAEFLSVLESRKVVNGVITSEPLIKPEFFSKYFSDFKSEYFRGSLAAGGLVPEQYAVLWKEMGDNGLRIPSNLIVIGTVNMDETTHQFSRKVIDRAMTIEMNLPEGEPFMNFFNNARDLEYTDSPTSHELYLPKIVKAADVVAELEAEDSQKTSDLKSKVATILTQLNEALNDTPFKIAYRVQNELMLYFHELWLEDKSRDWNEILRDSVDQILMMKVLPRVEGDEDLLEKPLASLATFCATGNYTNAAKKVEEMQKRLDRAHFTSYWP
ncbi:MAG: hypothetical protein NC342_02210 [Pseudoflavonifractor sp.]|nr:hypothetical protein [Alloprevotella sp.]MCM1116335.1 hypothetical protein [Pseudoflavonifractor sp.]